MRVVTIFFIGLFSINIAFADVNIFNAKEIVFAEEPTEEEPDCE
tara:strand:+ start:450 stop:581 length:132 start_codon:yes stop_codon:yes gene_type:complete